MVPYLLKTLVLAVFSFVIIYFYYFSSTIHIENFDWYLLYITIMWVIYGVYKFFQLEFSEKKAEFSLFKIFNFFLLHLLVLSILFFSYNNLWLGLWIVLFFKIIYFSFIPTFIILISLSFWRKLTSYLPSIENESSIYKFILSIWLWFFSFIFLLDIFWIVGFYNLYIVFIILGWFIAFSYKELINTFKSIFDYKFEVDIEEWSYLKLISTEFLFIISTLVLSISLISIVRPFPIGWDDLWAYMNYPHLMAEAGSILSLWAMQAWQTFTGIGYMFWSSTQAFFLNVVWGFLSFITLVLITSDLLKSKSKTFINIPMLVWTMFIAMPMIVFQQAKDMKLDAWLFFVSIVTLYLLYKYYLRLDNKSYLEKVKWFVNDKILHKWFNKSNLLMMFIIWLLAWFAFSIKFTTLLLISAIIWVIFFARLGVIWFLWYLAIFFALFTKADLWSKMNVVVNPENIIWFETNFSIVSVLMWLWLLWYAFIKNKWIIKKFFLELAIFILWIIIAILPWMGQHIVDSYPNISVGTILSWTTESFNFDKTLILSDEEIIKIAEEKQRARIDADWTATNEDFWRYFGYEKWANNYIKLPWNLTMQLNQSGEYTDIWFLFLALLPVVLLFLPFRKKYFSFLIVLILILELLIFIKTDNKLIENENLPELSQNVIDSLFVSNQDVFKDKNNNKDIYDIKVWNYISKSDINKLVNENNSFDLISKKATELFYKELTAKVLNNTLWQDIVLTKTALTDKDFELIKELRVLSIKSISFKSNIDSIITLKEAIDKWNFEEYRENLVTLWKNNRTCNQAISDFLASYNLPLWYAIVLVVFLLPVLFLLYFLDNKNTSESSRINLFKLNLVFASFYTFLWTISAFWIVWYWITMYFSFLLMIAIWVYYVSSYTDDDSEKIFFIKLFGTLVFVLIFLIYVVNSIFPHSFNNLKWAWYTKYKVWEITTINAPYLYHTEYLKILFHTNINQNKKEDFINEYISDNIKKVVSSIEKLDIETIWQVLTKLSSHEDITIKNWAIRSLNNIYKNISNPSDEYKSTIWIYRIWTFLKYHISENNKRLLEDSLIFRFNDYIYSSNINKTVENLKKLWLWYLLVDLNAATIDKDARHNLTTRYERLLSTFTSDKLELIETDSICLKVAIEQFNKSEKFSEDRETFLTIAWVNYESYTEEWTQINRWTKLMQCYRVIDSLIKENKINEKNYNYLLNINNYIKQNKDSFQTENQIFTLLQQQVKHWYKVLFKIK